MLPLPDPPGGKAAVELPPPGPSIREILKHDQNIDDYLEPVGVENTSTKLNLPLKVGGKQPSSHSL